MHMQKANNLLIKAWRLCTSLPKQTGSIGKKRNNKAGQVTPVGYFSVYVGPEKQRFVVKTEFANHPVFKALLEDAALEYGYKNDGPLLLPCDVDLFYNVLVEMDNIDDEDMIGSNWSNIQRFFSPNRSPLSSKMNEDYGGGYRLLNTSPMIKLNKL